MSKAKVLRDKLNYSIFPRSVYVFVGVFPDLLLGRNYVPFGEMFSISVFEIDSIEIDSLI